MAVKNSEQLENRHGPSGFIELNGQMLIVDYGQIYGQDGSPVGFLYEDGYLTGTSGPFGQSEQLRPIEAIGGCSFRGIDAQGMELKIPGSTDGPTGALNYNQVPFHVIHGRICNHDHRLVGNIDDTGTIRLRDHPNPEPRRSLSDDTQLATVFKGKKSSGEPWEHEFVRKTPHYKKERSYSDNEIMRYFHDFERLTAAQRKYVAESMRIWASSGILQVVRRSEGDAAISESVRHGAAAVTGVRTGMVHIDKDEFEKEIALFRRFGAVAVLSTRFKPYVEVRINLVVAHEYGHQLEFCLSQDTQLHIEDLYRKKRTHAEKLHPAPEEYDGQSELVVPDQVFKRVFVSGYAKASWHEYWAESVALFSVKEGRTLLKQMDPEVFEILTKVIFHPTQVMQAVFEDTMLELQASLRLGYELTDELLND